MTIKQGSPVETPHGPAEVLSLESETAGNKNWRVKLCLSGVERWYAEHNLTELAAAEATPPADAALADRLHAYAACIANDARDDTAMVRDLRQASAALRARAVPDGFVMVPVEPTEEMVIAALKEVDPLRELIDWSDGHGFMREDARRAYSAMLAASKEDGT